MTIAKVSILPESITNKIAAGEVVERPASVIKELVENSIDAEATEITIVCKSGGRRTIQIIDNGSGMSRDDALLSLERHATSKIKTEDDLSSIMTLGFRGEALPSIASVSRFNLKTRPQNQIDGTEIVVEGGRVKDVKSCGMRSGTIINVENLFFNTPARLKFMKQPETEGGHIADTVAKIAIANPDISFTLIIDDKVIFALKKSDLKRRVSQIVGSETGETLLQISASAENITIAGFISPPKTVRSSASQIYSYINGRFIKDKVVQHAIMQGYRGVIERGRYPVTTLFIEISPKDVDVNVHPTKHEVRFRRQSFVHDFIQHTIENSLKNPTWLITQPAQPIQNASENRAENVVESSEKYKPLIEKALQKSLSLTNLPKQNYYQDHLKKPNFANDAKDDYHPKEEGGYFSHLSIIGQFHGEYIICQHNDQLVIIDQHAASERVAYQRLKREKSGERVESQPLLTPICIDATFSESAAASKYCNILANAGFEIEPFGGNSLVIKSLPALLSTRNAAEIIHDILNQLQSTGSSETIEEIDEKLLAKIACHSVVRGVSKLDNIEIRELLYQMDNTEFAASCPHGRPVSHTITLKEIEKIFKR